MVRVGLAPGHVLADLADRVRDRAVGAAAVLRECTVRTYGPVLVLVARAAVRRVVVAVRRRALVA